MIIASIIFLLLALVAAIFGIAEVDARITLYAWIAFFVFLLIAAVLLVRGLLRKKTP